MDEPLSEAEEDGGSDGDRAARRQAYKTAWQKGRRSGTSASGRQRYRFNGSLLHA